MDLELYIIDAIGPFFRDYDPEVVNWSKIPFTNLESDGQVDSGKFNKVRQDFSSFIEGVAELGFNAISIDDVAHLVDYDFYPDGLRQKIRQYQHEYSDLFTIARNSDLKIFVTTDIMFFNREMEDATRNQHSKIITLLARAFEDIFTRFPVDGIIMRIGESDGVDVKGDFISRLTIKTPKQANQYIQRLLPIFETFKKYLIFRTWTFGAYEIGDLIWNRSTYEKVFRDIESENLVISMKYGDTDFFSNLELNPLFFHGEHKKLIELQTRREREGFGLFPFYVGWEYESYYEKLRDLDHLVGIWVWCQTGGWSKCKNMTFLQNSSVWSELNTYATLKIFRGDLSAEQALDSFFGDEDFVRFLRAYHDIYSKLLYIDGFSNKKMYFRRLRVLPLLWFYWDHITINPLMIGFHNAFGSEKIDIPPERFEPLRELGKKIGIPNIDFLIDTLKILYACRKALYENCVKERLLEQITEYQQKYLNSLEFSISNSQRNNKLFGILLRILVRRRPEYRLIDRIFLGRFAASLLRLVFYTHKTNMPTFLDRRAMKADVIFL